MSATIPTRPESIAERSWRLSASGGQGFLSRDDQPCRSGGTMWLRLLGRDPRGAPASKPPRGPVTPGNLKPVPPEPAKDFGGLGQQNEFGANFRRQVRTHGVAPLECQQRLRRNGEHNKNIFATPKDRLPQTRPVILGFEADAFSPAYFRHLSHMANMSAQVCSEARVS